MKKKIFLAFLVLGLIGANADDSSSEESTWEKVKSGTSEAWDNTKEAVNDASESETATRIKDGLSDSWEGTKKFFKDAKDKLTED